MATARFFAPPVTVTLVPHTASPYESWAYTLPSGRGGVAIGDLAWAAYIVLVLVNKNAPRRVHLRFPKARGGGLRSQTVTVGGPADFHRLRDVDVESLMRRHGLMQRGCVRPSRWWRRVAALWASLGERMPGAWPVVP
jgi:hypothetical protein